MFIHPTTIAASLHKIFNPQGSGDQYWDKVTLCSKFNTTYDSYWSNVKLAAHMTHDPYWGNVSSLIHANKDPSWSNTVLALHFNGTNGSTTFTDETGKTFTAASATISTTQSRFGGSSGYFSGSSQYIYSSSTPTDFAFGTGDFTIECWFYITSGSSGPRTIMDKTSAYSNANIDFRVEVNANGIFSFLGGPNINWFGGSQTLSTNTWHHGAVVRNGSNLLTFVDGILQSSQDATPINIGNVKSEICLGSYNNGGRGNYFNGYLDDVRITKGVARYTTSFEVIRGRFLDNTIFEESGKTITLSGPPVLSATQVKFGNTSMYFDGNTDYIQFGTDSTFDFGTDDFTIEFWWYYITNTNPYNTFLSSGSGPGTWSTGCVGFVTGPNDIWLGYHNGTTQEVCRYTGTWTEAWRFVALTRESGTIRLFIDGVLVSSGTYAGTLNFNNNNMTRIGCNPWDSPTTLSSLKGYLDDYRVTKGVARYTKAFTPPTAAFVDPYSYPMVIDTKAGKTVTAVGPLLRTQSRWANFNGMSLVFNGITDYLTCVTSVDFGFGTGSFTHELWIKTFDSTACLLDFRTSAAQKGQFGIFNGRLSVWNGTNQLVGTYPVNTNTWVHIVWQRYRGILTQYVNGVLDGYLDFTGIDLGSTRPLVIGATYTGTNLYTGCISDLRISKIARYGAEFSPPTYPFLDPYNMPEIVEETGKKLVAYGNAIPSSTTTKFGKSSCYFDGTGDYVQYSSSVIRDIAFTVEAWIFTSVSAEQAIVAQYDSGTTAGRFSLYINTSYQLEAFIGSPTYGNMLIYDPTTCPLNQWVHVAFTRAGDGTTYLFRDGVLVATGSSIQTIYQGPCSIGGQYAPSSGLLRSFTGYIDEVRITSGVDRHVLTHTGNTSDPYWDNVVLAMRMDEGDVYWNSVVLAMHMDGADNGTTFTDLKGATVSRFGNTVTKLAIRKFPAATPTASAYFDGTGDYLTVPSSANWNFGTGDFTVECWFYIAANSTTNAGGYRWATLCSALSASNGGIFFHINGDGTTTGTGFRLEDKSVTPVSYTWTTSVSQLTWHHVALVRSGTSVSCYFNGTKLASDWTTSQSLGTSSYALQIGGQPNVTSWESYLNGYIDDLRITKGVARYTSNFSVPTAPFPNGLFGDLKGNTITVSGNSTPSTTQAKFGTHSAYFDGVGDYITFASSQRFNLGAGALTIEFWFYAINPQPSGQARLFMFGGNGSTESLQIFLDVASGAIVPCQALGSPTIGFGSAGGAWSYGTWTHVAAVFESPTVKKLYVNGVKKGEQLVNAYTNAANDLDIGSDSSYNGYPFYGYIDDVRITKGVARYTADFTPPSSTFSDVKTYTHTFPVPAKTIPAYGGVQPYDPYWNTNTVLAMTMEGDPYWSNTVAALHMNTDPYWSYTALAMHMNGADNGTTFTDLTGKSITVVGNTVTKTAVKRFGTASAYFDGTGDYLTLTGTSMGTGDFTVEFWFYAGTNTSSRYVFESRSGGATYDGFLFYPRSNGKLGWWTNNALVSESATTYAINTWHHAALTRKDGIVYLFLNGNLETITANAGNFTCTAWRLGQDIALTNNGATFYVDDLRITVGLARYVNSFTVSHLPFLDNQFIDEKGKTVTSNGNATISFAHSKFGKSSAYFDGNGDYLTLGSSSDFDFSTGDFTIECWHYYVPSVNTNTYGCLVASHTATWSTGACGIFVNSSDIWFGLNDGTGRTIVTFNRTATPCWTHVALTRASGVVRLFIDGDLKSSATYASSINFNHNSNTRVGQNGWDGNTLGAIQGYIDDLRITKGVARYTASFTPSNEPFPDNQFIDSKYGATVIPSGTAAISGTQARFGKTSAYFDGTSNCYLTLPPSSNWNFGTGDFTVECWVYITGNGTPDPLGRYYQLICAVKNGAAVTSPFEFTITGDSYTTGLGLALWHSTNGGTSSGGLPFNKNCWNFVTVSRTTGIIYYSVNGTVSPPAPYEYSLGDSTNTLLVGGAPFGTYVYYLNGYIDDLRITKGVGKYTNTFIPPQQPLPIKAFDPNPVLGDPYWNNVVFATHLEHDPNWNETVLLLPMDGDPYWSSVSFASRFSGLDGGTTFTDLKGKAITRNGGAITKTNIVKFGSASAYFDGSGDYLTVADHVDFEFGSGDFTIECWIYPAGYSVGHTGIYTSLIYGKQDSIHFAIQGTSSSWTNVTLGIYSGSTWYWYGPGITLSNNQWYHIACTRQSGTVRIFVNGVMTGASGTRAESANNNAYAVSIGGWGNIVGYEYYFNGYIDELRITKGVARYTADFTVPTYSFLSGTFTDTKAAKTVTAYGNATLSTTQSKYGLSSAYFDGTGDYLEVPDSTDWDFGTGDFTIEAWIYIAADSAANGQNNKIAQIVGNFYNGVTYASGFAFNINGDSVRTGTGLYCSYNNAGSWTTLCVSAIPISQGEWHHVAVTRANSLARIFVDGDVHVETANSTNISLGYALAIGGQPNYTNYNSWFNGYIDDLRITKGVARYTVPFTPPTSTLLDNNFRDNKWRERGLGITGSVGNIYADTLDKKFGTTCAYFDGTGDYIATTASLSDYAFGTGDFTVEAWIRMPTVASSADRIIIDFYRNGSSTWQFFVKATGVIVFYESNPNVTAALGTILVNDNVWHHVAACRSSGTLRLYTDGVLNSTTANSKDHSALADYLAIGAQITSRNTAYDFIGYIDDVRITKGVARYVANFTPPGQFPDYLNIE